MRKATLARLFVFSGVFFGVARHTRGAALADDENGSDHVTYPTSAPLKPERKPKDFALRQRTDS
ncbi:MAG TPA: hypothetical protein GX523_16425, partial [Desulfitobacterium dehalogenans]|nr:hypothetical protein [Desulfitobacterium dehalogenans]